MWRRVIIREHANDDTMKTTDLGHRRYVRQLGLANRTYPRRIGWICREQSFVHRLWGPIDAAWPRYHALLNSRLAEVRRIADRIEDHALQAIMEIHLTFEAVGEADP